MQYIRSLDGLRGIAVLLVVLFHFGYVNVGWIGVQIFFVLSGFLITGILLHDADRPLKAYLKRFYTRRVLRIFPLYYGYLALVAAAFLLTGHPRLFGQFWPYLATYTYNFTQLRPHWDHSWFFTHLWSLSVEEQFYLLWPLLVFLLPRRRLRVALLAMIVLCPVVRGWLAARLQAGGHDWYAAGDATYWFTLSQFDAFATGAAIPVFGLAEKLRGRVVPLRLAAVSWLAVGLAYLFVLKSPGLEIARTSLGFACPLIHDGQHVWGYTLLNVASAATILLLLARDRSVSWLDQPALHAMGKISYGMYVFHWPLMFFFANGLTYDPRSPLGAGVFVVYLAALVLVSHLSHRYYETRFLALKDKWAA